MGLLLRDSLYEETTVFSRVFSQFSKLQNYVVKLYKSVYIYLLINLFHYIRFVQMTFVVTSTNGAL